ncbi:ATP-binding cassette domain-containing protein [Bacillus albus]|uniref:ATP-binding cassette domain-containing protein n=1 Tax=Bacillus albus TaxID=2026189 RepID=UPI00211B41CF|nr:MULTISPECIES: ATP-binding cassette domain-containing protein [Bacillus cereus group]MDA2026334.1 ATP-binding cassette domain-containing protein [Bacillus cereus group sp. Bcc03]MDA2713037.1 ATP-binding cassette domain-containing protein [Bacillus cereus group sp. Bc025]MDC6154966.1 ATP-binding cassette domain-containing protein [Bacillus albus]MDD8004443.1 ATP-binding cassette domain-containing protein [Bacillus albus]WJE73428.1 ATP-binding cassette domain-containing protein [Bacillus albus
MAIVGHNGSGKTTLIKCLLGLYPLTSGNIYFDNIPINKIQLHSLREHTTVMFQDFIQYHLTIRENIALGNVSEINNDEKLKNVAMQSGIHEDIQLFPNAYNTPLGRFLQEGEELSGGQWQKLAISRSLFKNGNIMILDEPTAALDPISEREIFDKFELLTNQKTTIMISHKMSAAKLADKIVVLDNGELVEFGTHEELFLKKGKYYELYTTQATLYQNKLDEVLI